MASLRSLVIFGLLAAASAAPWSADVPGCARECPVAGSQKLHYAPEKTYSYMYTGRSEIHMRDVEGGVSQMEWTSQVDLTWVNPCDMAITFKNPSFGGASGTPEASFLTRYPMMVAIVDGRIRHVCSHPDDDTWSINLKKGVASAFQNSLPSNSSVNTGLNFTETDVTGQGPTLYKVKNEGEKVIVEKMKNHRYMQERFPSQAETPMSWIKAPLPILESWSKCKQELTKGIYTSIVCEDKNVIKPALGSYKFIEAKQESELKFQSESSTAPPALSTLRGRLVQRRLLFDHETLKKDPKFVPELEQALKHVCSKTMEAVEKDAAVWVDRAIHLMRRVPEQAVEQMMQKVKSGEICREKQRMESLFLDILAYVQEDSTVKLMVRELTSGQATGGRAALYTAALYFTPRPSTKAVEAVKPLLEMCERFPMACLAASSMVHTYCRHNPHCLLEPPVQQAAQTLSQKIQERCSSRGTEETEKQCLATLKALGNMGVVTSEVARNVISIVEKQELENVVRVSATQVFRNSKCEREPTKQLVRIALDPKMKTEIRIASYLASIKCAVDEDLRKISELISREENTQVRGFILSHLWNLQESSAPHKERLRYILSSISIPSNFSLDIRKYSRNIDLSYYAPTFGVGAGVESDIVYATGSFIPRSFRVNMTSAMGATPVNLGEFGARFEGLEPIMEKVFGPKGYLKRSSSATILDDISNIFHSLKDSLPSIFRERRSLDMTAISHFLNHVYGDRSMKEPRADFFARFGGQELAYGSLTKKMFEGVTFDKMIEKITDKMNEMLSKMSEMNANSARALQLDFDYYLPTIQGLPLRMKLNGTAVVGLKMESRLNRLDSSSPSLLRVKPSLSGEVNGFVGFDSFMASVGVRTMNRISSKHGLALNIKGGEKFEIEIDIPEKVDIIEVKNENYLMKAVRGRGETRISPPGLRLSEVRHQNCFRSLEEKIGLKVCYDVKFPDMLRSQGMPLGQLLFAKLSVEKAESSMKGWKMMGNMHKTPEMTEAKIQMLVDGSSSPRKSELHFRSANEGPVWEVFASMATQASGGYKVELKTKNEDSEKLIEARAYSSRSHAFTPETQVMEVKLSTKNNGEESQVEMMAKTMNSLKPHIDYDFEVLGDVAYATESRIPYPRRLRKFNLRTIVKDFRFISAIEKKSESEFSTILKVGSKSSDKLVVEATNTVEGSFEEGITIKTVAMAKTESNQYKAVFDAFNTREKKGIALQVARSSGGSKVIEAEAMLLKSGQTHSLKFQMDMPSRMRPVKFEFKMEDQGSYRYQLQTALRHGSEVVLQGDGMMTAKFIPSMKQLQVDLRVKASESEPYSISTAIIWARNKQELAFDLKDQHQQFAAIRWDVSSESREETKTHFKVMLHNIIDHKIDAIISNKNIQVSFSNAVLPKSSSRHVRGFGDVDFENKKVKAEVSWDVDRDPNQKLSIEAMVTGGPSSPHQSIIHGGVTFVGKTYNYKAELRRADSQPWLLGKKDMSFEIITPAHKTHTIGMNLDVEKHSSSAAVKAQIMYKNPESKEYKMVSDISAEHLGRPYNFKFNAKADLTWPEGRQSSVTLESKHEFTGDKREVLAKVNINSPSLSKPMETSLTLSHEPNSYMAKWMIDVNSPADAADYELRVSHEGVQSFKVGFDLKEVVALLKNIEKMAGAGSGPAEAMAGAKYLVRYERPERSSHRVLIRSPSRHMEAEARYSPSEYRVTFHPEKERRDRRYEMALISSHRRSGEWERDIKYEARIHHPSLDRERRMEFAYTQNEQKIQGTLEMDIFLRSEDKITSRLESTMLAKNSWRVEAKLAGKVLKMQPKVIVAASFARQTVGFDLLFEKSPSARPSLVVSAKYDRSLGRNAAMALTVRTEEGPAMEMSASMRPKEEPSCNGLKISAKTYISVIGRYELASELCKPGFARISMWKEADEKHVIVKAGLRTMKDLEFSITNKDERRQKESHVAMMRIRLAASTLVNTELKWESEKVSELRETASDKMSRVSSGVWSWVKKLEQEVLKVSESSSPSSELSRLWHETKEELHRICSDLRRDGIIPSRETLDRWWNSHSLRNIINGYKMLWSQVDEIKRKMYEYVPNTVRSLKQRFSGLTEVATGVVVGGARWMRTGEMPEEVKRISEKIQNSALWEDLKTMYHHLMSMFGDQKEAMIDILNKYKEVLMKDLQNILRDIGRNVRVQKTMDWVINEFNVERLITQEMETIVNKMVQSILLSSVQIRGNHVEVQVPLRQPVNSLTMAWRYMLVNPIPVPENLLRVFESVSHWSTDYLVWSYYTLLPRRFSDLLPPFKRTAVVVDGSEILTFDGTVLRAPHSPCKVLLAASESFSLMMENPSPSAAPKVTFKVGDQNIIMGPDHKVSVNGKVITGPREIIGEVTVIQNPEELTVMSPFMTVRVHPRNKVISAEVSGWKFGRIAGLMGTYDGEIANDRLTMRGSRAANLQELVRSWQVDQSCSTPHITSLEETPIQPLRYLQCEALLGIRSRCNPVVRPDSFIRMCLTARNACDAARAYRAVCSTKGVKDVVPLAC